MTLSEYFEIEGLNDGQFAKRIGVTRPAVSFWRRGIVLPRLELMRRIEDVTEGAVKPADWVSEPVE